MLRKTLIATALLAAVGAASAATTTWGAHAAAESALTYVPNGAFFDVYDFSLLSAQSVTSSVVSLNLPGIYSITGANYMLWQDNGPVGFDGSDTLLNGWAFDGTTGSTSHSVNLLAGSYFYTVSGVAAGGDPLSNAGIYSIASTIAPVPEPESYALMLVGLGVVGFLAGRRRRA